MAMARFNRANAWSRITLKELWALPGTVGSKMEESGTSSAGVTSD
jgi:hypothetical protein